MQIEVVCISDYDIFAEQSNSFAASNLKTADELIDWAKTVPRDAEISLTGKDYSRPLTIRATWKETRGKAAQAEAQDGG